MKIVKTPKIIVIYGPTTSGKSGVAIEIAKKFNGEIISADSRQTYRGLDIGSGKVNGAWSMGHGAFLSEKIPHHLIDVAEPMKDFNISHFKTQASVAMEKILAKGKVPIICGGTNFWVDAIVKNTNIPEVAPNELLRNKLRNKSTEELFSQLKKLDPRRAKNIDAKNPYRLIRAIEICEKLGKVPTQSSVVSRQSSKYKFLQIGIATERENLNEKIKKRLDERFDEGMIKEVQKLNKQGVSYEWMERIGLEYRWIARFLQGNALEKEMREKLYFDIIHFAKRQMTWLKRNKEIIWLKDHNDIEKEVEKFLQK